jgi:hypothetical protein
MATSPPNSKSWPTSPSHSLKRAWANSGPRSAFPWAALLRQSEQEAEEELRHAMSEADRARDVTKRLNAMAPPDYDPVADRARMLSVGTLIDAIHYLESLAGPRNTDGTDTAISGVPLRQFRAGDGVAFAIPRAMGGLRHHGALEGSTETRWGQLASVSTTGPTQWHGDRGSYSHDEHPRAPEGRGRSMHAGRRQPIRSHSWCACMKYRHRQCRQAGTWSAWGCEQ